MFRGKDIKVGDIVERLLAQKISMPMTVREIRDNCLICDPVEMPFWPQDYYTFDIDTGAEIDEYLEWGPQWGKTGSCLVRKIEQQ